MTVFVWSDSGRSQLRGVCKLKLCGWQPCHSAAYTPQISTLLCVGHDIEEMWVVQAVVVQSLRPMLLEVGRSAAQEWVYAVQPPALPFAKQHFEEVLC